jgi:hypothetical protein
VSEVALILFGLFLGVPFSIGANLMTPRWQAFWSKRSETARRKNQAKLEAYDRWVDWYGTRPELLNGYVLRQLVFASMAGLIFIVFFLVVGGSMLVSRDLETPSRGLDVPFLIVAVKIVGSVSLVVALLGVWIATRALVSAFRLVWSVALAFQWPLGAADMPSPAEASESESRPPSET